jgi:glycerol-3-phosphate dehydrogenase
MIGTCHIPWHDAPHRFKLNEAMVQGFLDQINSAHAHLRLSLEHVRRVTWGFLPVHREDANRQPVRLTRDGVVIDHQKKEGISGLISVLGTKYTTARVVAEQAVDLAVGRLGMKAKKCLTHITPVKGGKIDDFRAFRRNALHKVPRVINERSIEHLLFTYGSEYPQLVECLLMQPDLARRIDPLLPVTAAEVEYAIRHEMALTLADVIERRTELGSAGLPSMTTLEKCASLIGRELKWSVARQQQELEAVIQSYPFGTTEARAT